MQPHLHKRPRMTRPPTRRRPQQVLQATGRGVAADLGQLAAILALGPTEQTL